MATTYTKTANYGLNLYGDNDPADLRDGHNSNMVKIDAALTAQSGGIAQNGTNILAVQAVASAAAPQATTYTKVESDAALALKANSSDVYTKTQSDTALALKANNSDVYTKSEVDSSQNAQNGTISGIGNRVTSIENSLAPKTHYLVAFGDSISVGGQDGVSNRYTQNVANSLGLFEKNFAVNGAAFGFTRTDGSTTIPVISSQVDTASNDSSFDHNLVDYIIIGGGVNDANSEQLSDSQSGLTNTVSKCVAAFPSAKIILNLGQGGFVPTSNGWNQYKSKLYEGLLKTAKFLPVTIVPAYKILFPYQWDPGIMESDGLHPAQSGHYLMAKSIVGAINGGHDVQWCPTEWFNQSTSNTNLFPSDSIWNNDISGGGYFDGTTLRGEIDLSSDMVVNVHFHVGVNLNSGNINLTNVLRLPKWAIWRGGAFPSKLVLDNNKDPLFISAPFTIDANGRQWIGISMPARAAGNPLDFYLDLSWRVI